MRTSIVSICAAALITGSLCSATYADPLAPGKPAGVRAAQMSNKDLLVIGGVAVVAAAVLIANVGGDGHNPGASLGITVTSTSATNP